MYVSEEEELPRVMQEITEALKGRGAALTLHPGDGYPEQVIYAAEDAGISREMVQALLSEGIIGADLREPEQHRWVSASVNDCSVHTLSIPVQRVPGHGRLAITVFYDLLDAALRADAEAVYLARRPFAIGYFRLWQVNRTSQRRMAATESALNVMSLGVLLVSASSTILFANDAARSLLDQANGLAIRGDQLRACGGADTLRLQAAVSHVANFRAGGRTAPRSALFTVAREGEQPLVVSVLAAAQPPDEPGDTAATVVVVDPTAEIDTWLVPVCKLFGLTNVETSLAQLLVSGSTLSEAAVRLRIKEATVRSYLKLIFTKTGVSRQSEMIRVLLSNLVRLTGQAKIDVI